MIDDVPGGWPAVLSRLIAGDDLSASDAESVMATILAGEATQAQIAAFMVALSAKGESVAEITGLVRAMLRAATPLDLPPDTIDIVGMGGGPSRRAHALNVSTMACFVAAGAGAIVCKHGNRKASSTSGSFDLLEALGIRPELSPDELARCVAEVGIGFAFARTFHPAMRFAAPVRAELGIPSVFNILGPLSHPGRVTRQVVGVADRRLARPAAEVLLANGARRSMVVHGDGALDELAVTGPSLVVELDRGQITESTLDPRDLGFTLATADALVGGDPAVNATIARRVLGGETGAVADVVVLNAAAGLLVGGLAPDLGSAVAAARGSIESGAALAKLEALVAATNR